MKRLAALAMTVLLAACGIDDDRVAGGTSSEVPNALHGRILSESGAPAAGCAVRLASMRSRPDSLGRIDSTVTDSDGNWRLPSRTGTDSLAILFDRGGSMAIAYLASGAPPSLPRTDTLHAAAWMRGSVAGTSGATRVSVEGTPFAAVADPDGRFLLGPVPAGALSLLVSTDSAGIAIRRAILAQAKAGDTTTLPVETFDPATWSTEDFRLWPSSRRATIDLTASGAFVAGDHAGFVVPVRLEGIVDARTVSPGELRFDDGLGLKLPFSVEEWNATTGTSLVWVRLDTANGNSSQHELRVHWGRSGARIPSDMPAVFGPDNGFLAAWHGASAPGLTWTGTTGTEGAAGQGWTVSGNGSFASDSVALGGDASWTIGLWVRLDGKSSGETLLAGFSDGPDSVRWGVSVRDDLVVRVWSGADTARSLEAGAPLALDVWTHVVATFDGAKSRVGLVIDTVSYARQDIAYPKASRQRLRGASGVSGAFDEIRLSGLDREKEWSILESRTLLPKTTWLRWE